MIKIEFKEAQTFHTNGCSFWFNSCQCSRVVRGKQFTVFTNEANGVVFTVLSSVVKSVIANATEV